MTFLIIVNKLEVVEFVFLLIQYNYFFVSNIFLQMKSIEFEIVCNQINLLGIQTNSSLQIFKRSKDSLFRIAKLLYCPYFKTLRPGKF